MKSVYYFCLAGAVVVAAQGVFVEQVNALSCIPQSPVIGVVRNVAITGAYADITLEKVFALDETSLGFGKIIDIDIYENIAKEYKARNFQLTEQHVPDLYQKPDSFSVLASALEEIRIEKGDILINGPPFHVCTYRFIGLFGREGTLQYAIIDDDYQDYSYRNKVLEVEPGKEIECGIYDQCTVEVRFTLDGVSFNLLPGEAYDTAGHVISRVSLLESSNVKDGAQLFDWGFGIYVTYVVHASSSRLQQPPLPMPSPQPVSEPVPGAEQKNIFQKIWEWFVSLLT